MISTIERQVQIPVILRTPEFAMRGHYALKASTEFSIVAASAEKALQSLNFRFIKNMTERLVELEVQSPEYLRIVIEKRSDPDVRNYIILPSIKEAKGTLIDVWLDLDHSNEEVSIVMMKQFLKTLLPLLPVAPWSGLRFHESSKERKRWHELTGIP